MSLERSQSHFKTAFSLRVGIYQADFILAMNTVVRGTNVEYLGLNYIATVSVMLAFLDHE